MLLYIINWNTRVIWLFIVIIIIIILFIQLYFSTTKADEDFRRLRPW